MLGLSLAELRPNSSRDTPGGVLPVDSGESDPIDLTAYMPLVRSIARRVYSNIPSYAAIELNDLMQAGNLGLVHASRSYRAGKQVPFAVYARFRIRGEILDSLRQIDMASRSLRRWEKRILSAKQELAGSLNREPTDEEVSEKMAVDVSWLEEKRRVLRLVHPASGSAGALEDRELNDIHWRATEPSPEALRAEGEARQLLGEAIRSLPERSREIVTMYYLSGLTMRQIGERFKVNESRVSQIHKSALHRMGRFLRSSGVSSPRDI